MKKKIILGVYTIVALYFETLTCIVMWNSFKVDFLDSLLAVSAEGAIIGVVFVSGFYLMYESI